MSEYKTGPKATARIVARVLAEETKMDTHHLSGTNTVMRELAVLGVNKFWALLNSADDPKLDPDVQLLSLTPDALERFSTGVATFSSRLTKALSRAKTGNRQTPQTLERR